MKYICLRSASQSSCLSFGFLELSSLFSAKYSMVPARVALLSIHCSGGELCYELWPALPLLTILMAS